jgi:hypothetical protein
MAKMKHLPSPQGNQAAARMGSKSFLVLFFKKEQKKKTSF